MSIRSYCELAVWQKGMDLVIECYKCTDQFPKSETYGLASQLKRAAVSIPSNIAEGQGHSHTKEFLRYLYIARGSLLEVETHLRIAARLQYINDASLRLQLERCAEVGRMLNGLIRSLSLKIDRRLATGH